MPQTFSLNGMERRLDADPGRTLLSVLRDDLQLTGAKYGCGEGECGACTVLLDGKPIRSCITDLGDCLGKSITTIEGLEREGKLHPLQSAFMECDALQCGYCNSGMIMSGVALLARKPRPERTDVVHALQGNLCRCGTYARIVAAVLKCGAIINPGHLENQVEGAVMMGLGGALFEAIKFDGGKVTNASFGDYRVPRFSDLPQLETVLLNRPDLPSAGAGETPIIAIAPAIGNAIQRATGRRLRSLPMLLEKAR